MAEVDFTLSTFVNSWNAYQDRLKEALASLTAEHLALRAAPRFRSVGENALHIVGCRSYWFTVFMGEHGGEETSEYARWNEIALRTPVPGNGSGQVDADLVPTGAELALGLDRTWRLMADCLARWTPAEMRATFPDDRDGTPVEVSRAFVVWRVLEHDLHHGGEISLTLGLHGIRAGFAT